MALPHPTYDPAVHFREALLSREFRQSVQAAFLLAHPEKGRDVFIHVPKCAGTDLILNLGRDSVPLPKMLELPGWMADDLFLEALAGLSRAAMSSDRLFAYGHMELGAYVDTVGVRPVDRIFTVLRDPIDQLISQANYVVGRLRQDPTGQQPDTAEHLRILGLTALPPDIGFGDLKDLTIKVLLNGLIAEPNRSCFYLGRNSEARYATAMSSLIIHDVEVTTTDYYNRWLQERWGITESARHNRSEAILPNAEARRLCGAALAASVVEDQKLFDVVDWAVQQSGAASVTGQQIARLLGPPLTDTLSSNQIPVLPGKRRAAARPSILVAGDEEHVSMYLAPASVDVPGRVDVETILAVDTRADAGAEDYLRDGWSPAEDGFTWTSAVRCGIRLPPMWGGGTFLLRLVVSPFVAEGQLPFQPVELMLGGVSLGSCKVRDKSVIEAALPSELLMEGMPVDIVLHVPGAARPNDFFETDDQRLIALAVYQIVVLRLRDHGAIA